MNISNGREFVEDDFIYCAHPNPAWARREWTPLDGVWQVERSGRVQDIRVPFPIGSEDSGVDFPDRGNFVYTRAFEVPGDRAETGIRGRDGVRVKIGDRAQAFRRNCRGFRQDRPVQCGVGG